MVVGTVHTITNAPKHTRTIQYTHIHTHQTDKTIDSKQSCFRSSTSIKRLIGYKSETHTLSVTSHRESISGHTATEVKFLINPRRTQDVRTKRL